MQQRDRNEAGVLPILRVRLLGAFQIAYGDEPITTLNSGRLQSLFAYLLLHRDAPQSRQSIAFSFWPGSNEAQARTNLRNLIYQLRQALPAIDRFLVVDAQTLRWQSDQPYALDVRNFEHALDRADRAEEQGNLPEVHAALEQAVHAYGGELLPDCYDEWLIGERERLRQSLTTTLERLITCLEQQRDYSAAIHYAERLLHDDPLRESSYRRLMRLHALNDDRAGALRVYDECQLTLQRELAVAPGPATRDTYTRLLQLDSFPSRASTGNPGGGTPLVSREREWRQLCEALAATCAGQARVVLIAGEAGIGKSRLAEELLGRAEQWRVTTARARSYAAEGRLAYAPVAGWLRDAAIRPGIDRLDPVWRAEIARLLPELLVEDKTLAHPGPLTESWQVQHFYSALAQATIGAAQPLLLLLDDLQWSDPGTLEWLHYLLRVDPGAQLLFVGTVRDDELEPDHPLHALALELRREDRLVDVPLGPLDAQATVELATHVAGRAIDDVAAARLYEESEGHPLFIVETVRVGGEASPQPGTVSLPRSAAPDTSPAERGALPPKVQAVITARLAQLTPTAHELAGLAAAIGREFTSTVLTAASAGDEEQVAAALDELWQRQIIREQGADVYDFSHDRIREVAYAEVTPARRRLLHRHVARALTSVHQADLDPVSGQLAAHYERAGELEQAVAYYQRAAEAAQQVYANVEAISLLRRGLAVLARLSESAARDERELALQTALSVSLNALKTFDAPKADERYGAELDQVYARVSELSERLGVTIDARILRAMALVHITSGEIRQALELGEQLLTIARCAADDPVLYVEAHYTIGAASHWLGRLSTAQKHLESALEYYDRQRHRIHIIQYAQDPGAICLSRLALTLLHLGYPEQARRRLDTALTLARELGHPQSLAYTLNYVSWMALELRDVQMTRESAEEMLELAGTAGLGTWQLLADANLGWTQVQSGEAREGIDRIRHAISGDYATRQLLHAPLALTLLTDAYRLLGAADAGLATAAEGFRLVERTGARYIEAELHRLRGELLHQQATRENRAEASFREALLVAGRQEARLLQLRAAVSLGRLLQQQGRIAEARDALGAVYGWFNEGFDTPDLRDARELLTTLQTLR